MDQMAIDIEKAGPVILPVDDVVVEDLVVHGAGLGHLSHSNALQV